ncbi:unnamed protein product [Angiostrongylus costaricensis]|uniref:Uncharacterized protein n=1 Tax=Angiostrongylus costaricensis TaxID=334426 RepID=A0A158PD36_ANGCS|nr:unnamed protein product [Angiostrongylus costaricensis]
MASSRGDTDESSRDSGFGEMECENMPVDFAQSSSAKRSTYQFKSLDMEMDDLVIEESLEIQTTNMICTKTEELEVRAVLSNMRSLRRGLADVTNRATSFSARCTLAESPKSRKSVFAKPYLRTSSLYNKRKRDHPGTVLEYKRHRIGGVIEEDENYHLETVTTNDSQAFRRIDANTLCRLMKSMSSHEFAEKAQMLRSIDRQRNVDVYPKVDFPEIYVVDKGYRNFFEMFADSTDKYLCEPCSYVTMVDGRFAHDLKQFSFHKKSWGNSTCPKSLSSQTRLALRKLSEDSLDSPSSTGVMKPSSRRPLFNATPKTPETTPPTPTRQLHFS